MKLLQKPLYYIFLSAVAIYSCNRPASYQIPAGYSARDSVKADINGDKIKDLILVLQHDSDAIGEPRDRPVVILTGTGKGYTFATQCDSLVMRTDMGGAKTSDPYTGIKVDTQGCFTVSSYGGLASGGWEHYFTFCYNKQEKDWFLSKVENSSYTFNVAADSLEVSSSSDTTLTPKDFGNIRFSQFSYEQFPVE